MSEEPPKDPAKKRAPRKITAQYLHNAGLHYLQRFPAGTAHFRKVMSRKITRSCQWHTTQNREDCFKLLDDLIEQFIEQGLLNDEYYSRAMVTSLRRRGLSARAIQARLMAKGLPAAQIAAALTRYEQDESPDRDSEYSAALTFARRKHIGPYRKSDVENNDNSTDKALAKMARAGFSYELSRKIIEMTAGDLAAENQA